ncbi:MAG: DNA polymerase III subunit delta [bacterium]|nr:DNA polymerase III subunit delta [bacterium]
MIIFLYGEDTYRSKQKLDEIIEHYKKIHKSGLNLTYIDAERDDFNNLMDGFKIVSMFSEKKLMVLKNVFSAQNFQEGFLKEINKFKETKDIIVIFEEKKVDERNKLFKILKKEVKCQEFDLLKGAPLLNWIKNEFKKNGAKIDFGIEGIILTHIGNNLWQIQNEIKKLSDFKAGKLIKKEDVDLLVRPKIETDIFKTIDALASKNKKQAFSSLHKHLENGDNILYLLSMIAFQFRNLLIIKDLIEKQNPYSVIAKKSGLHPFVVKKSYYLCNQFSYPELKKIYQKIFQADLDIKTGKMEPETALDLLVSEI